MRLLYTRWFTPDPLGDHAELRLAGWLVGGWWLAGGWLARATGH